MNRFAEWSIVMGLAVLVGLAVAYITGRAPDPTCQALTIRAGISARAAEICTAELIGCSLTFKELERVVAEQEAAKACK